MNFFKILFLPITAPINFIQNNFKAVLFVSLLIFFINSNENKKFQQPNLQIINLTGPILCADKIIEQIDSAKENRNIKGVLFVVNSPGGAVAPSIEIAYAIKELNSIKPVVAYANGIMASGSYYASIYAKQIIANPGSMIGSIGVIIQSIDSSELLAKIGIKTQVIKQGKYKEVGTPTRKWKEYEKKELNKVIKATYDMFVEDVAKARKLDIKNYKLFADAHIFTASQAKHIKLIDKVSTLTIAKNDLITLSKVKKPIWKKDDKFDKIMNKFLNSAVEKFYINFNKFTHSIFYTNTFYILFFLR